MLTAVEIEASRFKAVPGGYLYEVANPWLFAPARRYIVSEAQKAELLAITATPGQWLFIVHVATFAWISTAVLIHATLFGLKSSTWAHGLISVALASVPMYVWAVFSLFLHQARIRPILAAATPTTDRFTSPERVVAILKAFTPGWLIFFAAASAFGALGQLARLLYQMNDPLIAGTALLMSGFYIAANVGLTVLFLILLRAKRREQQMSI
jgi:hypothetical protein